MLKSLREKISLKQKTKQVHKLLWQWILRNMTIRPDPLGLGRTRCLFLEKSIVNCSTLKSTTWDRSVRPKSNQIRSDRPVLEKSDFRNSKSKILDQWSTELTWNMSPLASAVEPASFFESRIRRAGSKPNFSNLWLEPTRRDSKFRIRDSNMGSKVRDWVRIRFEIRQHCP